MNKAVVDSRLVVHGGHDGNKWVADMHILAAWPVTRFELPGYASYIQEDGRDGERERERDFPFCLRLGSTGVIALVVFCLLSCPTATVGGA